MIVIIIILFILAAGASVGIYLFLKRRRIRQERREDEIYNVAEQLKQMTHQIEEASEDEGLPSNEVKGIQKLLKDTQVQVNKIEPDTEMPQLKEGSKKVAHQVEGTTKSKSETVSRYKKLEKSEDDDISILAEKLTKLADEYEETYQKLRQIIANKYKQLQDVSQYINTQTERLKKLTAQGNTDSAQAEDVHWEGVSERPLRSSVNSQASHAWEGVSERPLRSSVNSQASPKAFGVGEASEHAWESTFNEIETPACDAFHDAFQHPPKYTEVQKLAEQGIDRAEIALRTELPIGEVDLLLSLTKVGGQEG